MTERALDQVHDPKRLRALSHPLRWKLMDLIDMEDTATATRCAEALGESVASCSYHLNMLAKYGFVEEAPGGHGREKPWRLVSGGQRLMVSEQTENEGQLAAEAAVESFLAHAFESMRAATRRRDREPEDWRRATGFGLYSSYLTAAESQDLRDRIEELLEPYGERVRDTALRPAGARHVRVFTSAFVAAEPPGRD